MTVHVEILSVFSVRTSDPEGLPAHGASVMEQLLLLEADDNIVDSAVSVDRDARLVTIEVVGCGPDDMQALINGVTAMRAAIHAAGGSTPEWPNGLDHWEIIDQRSGAPELADA